MMSFFYCMTCMATVVIETRTLFTEIMNKDIYPPFEMGAEVKP